MTTIATNPVPPTERTVAMLLDPDCYDPENPPDSVPDIRSEREVGGNGA